MIPGGMRDAEAFAKHFAFGPEGKDSPLPGMFLGAITVAIGSYMLVDGGKKLWADWARNQAKAAKPHAERVRRTEHHEHER